MVQTSKQSVGRGDGTRSKQKCLDFLVTFMWIVQLLGKAEMFPQEQVLDHEICKCY